MEDVRQVEVLLPRDVRQVSLDFVHSFRQAELSQVFLENEQLLKLNDCDLLMFIKTSVGHAATIYLDVVADFNRYFGEGNGHWPVLHLAKPCVNLVPGQKFLQAFQGLKVVGHDEDHGGLLLTQRHVQHKDTVLRIIIEVIQSCEEQIVGDFVF